MIRNPAIRYELYFSTIAIISATDIYLPLMKPEMILLTISGFSWWGECPAISMILIANLRYKSLSMIIIRRMILMLGHKDNGFKTMKYNVNKDFDSAWFETEVVG